MAQSEQELDTLESRAMNLGYELRDLGLVTTENSNDVVDITTSDILQQALRASENIDRSINYDSMDGAIDALSQVAKGIEDEKSASRQSMSSFSVSNVDLVSNIPFYSMETSEPVPINDSDSLSMNLQHDIASVTGLGGYGLLSEALQKHSGSQSALDHFGNNGSSFCDKSQFDSGIIIQDKDTEPYRILPQVEIPKGLLIDESPPLGSSANPIQIIQQGSTYLSNQRLNVEQLQQIGQVLQEQQQSTNVSENGVLYNSATNTRIVYRVVYPNQPQNELIGQEPNEIELELQSLNKDDRNKNLNQSVRNRGRPKRNWSKRPEDDIQLCIGPLLSREEKEEKKKHRPRTRSGRISKPPSYMIKDYKRIHHLDFNNEPLDDSDGGYSDFRQSDEDASKRSQTPPLPPGVSTTKPRNYKCPTCEKAYIGRGGLARHFRLHVGHGCMPEGEDIEPVLSDENSNGSAASASSNATFQLDRKCDPLRNRVPNNKEGFLTNHQLAYLARRRAKLKDILRSYRDEELMDILLPRISQALTLWEFLLVKSEQGEPPQAHVPDLFKHFEHLLKKLRDLAKVCLTLSTVKKTTHTPSEGIETDKIFVEIASNSLSKVLEISTGIYEVDHSKFEEQLQALNESRRRKHIKRAHQESSKIDNEVKRFCMGGTATTAIDSVPPGLISDSMDMNIPILGSSLPDEEDDDPLDLSQLTADDVSNSLDGTPCKSIDLHLNVTTNESLSSNNPGSVFTISALGKMDAVLTSVNAAENNMSRNNRTRNTNQLDANMLFSSLSSPSPTAKTVEEALNISLRNLQEVTVTSISTKNLDSFTGALNIKSNEAIPTTSLKVKKVKLFGRDPNSREPSNSLVDEVSKLIEFDTNSNKTRKKTVSVSEVLDIVNKDSNNVIMNLPSLGDMTLSNSCDETQNFHNGNKLTARDQSNEALLRDMCSGGNETVQLVAQDILKAVAENSNTQRDISEVIGSSFESESEGPSIIPLAPESPILEPLSPNQLDLNEVGDALTHQSFLPGNLIVVQNPDGTTTLQLPGEPNLPLETIQAFLAMDQNLTSAALDSQLKSITGQETLLYK